MDDLDVLVTSNAENGFEERIIEAEENYGDAEIENVLRPKSMEGYIGQQKIKDNLKLIVKAIIIDPIATIGALKPILISILIPFSIFVALPSTKVILVISQISSLSDGDVLPTFKTLPI